MDKIVILASKSKVRKDILNNNGISCQVEPSNVDEDIIKESLEKQKASPEIVSKNLAELKANKVSQRFLNEYVLGADSVIDLKGKVISKPTNREEATERFKVIQGAFDELKKYQTGGRRSIRKRKDK